MYLGVDEAGKGPVLGPMVAAAVIADPSSLPTDVDDSKRVSPVRREAIDAALRDADDVVVGVAFVEPSEIDRPDTDMNTLTVRGQARAVRAALDDRCVDADGSTTVAPDAPVRVPSDEPVRVVADAGDTSEDRFARRLTSVIETNRRSVGTEHGDEDAAVDPPPVDVDAAHGADEDDPVVGAASIVAKVARDARMATVDAEYSEYEPIGSGYPSDPATRSFLRSYVDDHGEVPDCARRSWSTCDDVLAAAAQSGLDEF